MRATSLALALVLLGCATSTPQPTAEAPPRTAENVLHLAKRWQKQRTDDFQWSGQIVISDDAVALGEGQPYTGVRWPGAVPREDYEIELEARRTSGGDIFCGLTGPVGDAHVSFVLGGWGDCVIGLSNVDGFNASENETTMTMSFENDRWYRVKMRVTKERIEGWIDGARVIDQEREGHTFTTYPQLRPLHPLGIFSWMSSAEIRSAVLRKVSVAARPAE